MRGLKAIQPKAPLAEAQKRSAMDFKGPHRAPGSGPRLTTAAFDGMTRTAKMKLSRGNPYPRATSELERVMVRFGINQTLAQKLLDQYPVEYLLATG